MDNGSMKIRDMITSKTSGVVTVLMSSSNLVVPTVTKTFLLDMITRDTRITEIWQILG